LSAGASNFPVALDFCRKIPSYEQGDRLEVSREDRVL